MDKKVKVSELVTRFHLDIEAGELGLNRCIVTDDLNRPGLEMAGYFKYYPSERIQILGRTELAFLDTLASDERLDRMKHICHKDTPCIIITRELTVPTQLIKVANERSLPVLKSSLATTILMSRITNFLERKSAPKTTIHGVLIDIYGVGMLITGVSGIGKSETALDLVKRGHRLIADDAVEIRQTADFQLFGTAPQLIRHLLEIRGLGILNIMTLFGAGAVKNDSAINLVISLENWQKNKQYDRLGLDEETIKIIDTKVPLLIVPVRPGRNVAIILEVAAMNFRLKNMGYNAAEHFTKKLIDGISEEE